MIYVYPNTVSTFHGDRETAIEAGYIEIDDDVYADLIDTKKKWQDGEIVDDETYEQRKSEEEQRKAAEAVIAEREARICELKGYLSDTDYKAIKYAEGWLTEEEYAPFKAQREEWREEIRELEEVNGGDSV